MKMRHFRSAVLLLSVLAPGVLCAQSAEFYPLELVKPGQKGQGRTVFEGTVPEEFGVEILGVLKNVGPKQNMILARISGEKVEKTGIFAGMSGSPVYLEGKLVGAIAYAFRFAKEPIAGITPIQEIVDIFKEMPQTKISASARDPKQIYQAAELALPSMLPEFPVAGSSSPWPASGKLSPIATPLSLSGFSPSAIQQFAPYFESMGLTPVRGMGTAKIENYKDAPLQAGSTISVQMVRGDMDLSVSGTVTHVSGNKIYAFGHPFLNIGYTDMPLNKAVVLTIIPSLMNSDKVSATADFVGTIKQDRATGIMGVTGEKPKLIPVHLKLLTSRNEVKEFNYEVITDNFLTPFLMTFTVHNSIVSSERAIGGQTVQVKCKIAVKGQPEVNFENAISTPANGPVFAALAASSPVNFLLNSGFDLAMEKIDIEITAAEQTREALLEKVWQDKSEIRPGEELNLTVFIRKQNGDTIAEKYPVKIPDDVGPGVLNLTVGDGLSIAKADARDIPGEFVPQNLNHLIKAINNLKKNDRLYIQLSREQPGIIMEGEALPDLPPSLRALYDSGKVSGDTRSIKKVVYVEYELPPADFVLTGQKTISVKVK